MNKVLIMFSGGMDSTAVLYKYLSEGWQVHAHHLILINKENRWQQELNACKDIVSHLKQQHDFEYTESSIDYTCMNPRFPFDMDLYKFWAGMICLTDKNITHVAYGATKDDTLPQVVCNRNDQIFDIVTRKNVISVKPFENATKKEIFETLPESLRTKFWSCRRPKQNNAPCYKCKTCIILKEFIPNY